MDCSPAGSSVLGILQVRILEYSLLPSLGNLNSGIEPASPALQEILYRPSHQRSHKIYRIFSKSKTIMYVRISQFSFSLSSVSCLDCSPPGSSVHGILQARILEWVAIPLSRRSSQTRDRTPVSLMAGRFFLHHLSHPGSHRNV